MKVSAVARVAITIVAVAAAAAARGFPDKPVQYIIPFAAAGESDVAARLQAQVFATKYGKEMIVINKPGAGGGLAVQLLARAPSDGYTLMTGTVSTLSIVPAVEGHHRHDGGGPDRGEGVRIVFQRRI